MDKKSLSVYWGGDLFDSKHLGGNLLLSEAIERLSGGRYRIMLPQNGECEVIDRTAQSIRDEDFKLLFSCDLMLANFDGTDLDSGTVVEFCFAKMVDMPTVLLRTDFRHSGDQALEDGEPWNLMCSHYPRTRVLHINGMVRYHETAGTAGEVTSRLHRYYDSVAADVVKALDEVVQQQSWLKKSELFDQYSRTMKSIGGSINKKLPPEVLSDLVEAKQNSGLYS